MEFLPAIATAFQVVGAVSGAVSERNAQKFNAAVAERNAAVTRQQAAVDAETQARQARQRLGSMRAAYGDSGVSMEGSPLDVMESSAAAAELDKLNILYRGELQAMGYEDTAALSRSRASSATTAGIFKAGSALLTGAEKGAFGQDIASKFGKPTRVG